MERLSLCSNEKIRIDVGHVSENALHGIARFSSDYERQEPIPRSELSNSHTRPIYDHRLSMI